MDQHTCKAVYQEASESWAIVCSCNWKEKGLTKDIVLSRFATHQKFPTRP